MRLLVFIFSIFNFLTITSQNSVHEFDIITIDGTTKSLSAFKGKKMLFVNTASHCGFTSQYEALQNVHSKYGNDLVIIGFPANNFGRQEPGSNSDIKTFCSYQNNNFEQSVPGVSYNQFEGPHPAGLVGTHIHFLYPVGQNRTVWTISWQEVISLGYLLSNKNLRSDKYISIGGPNCHEPKILKVKYGSNLSETSAGKILDDSRVISGSVLHGHTGENVMNYLGAFDNQVSVLPDQSNDILFNWAMPGSKLHSKLPAFISSWIKPKTFNFNVSMNGGNRAIVPISSYQEIMPLNILTTQLLKSLVTLDIELGEKLGVLELAPEDLALASYVCPSKYDYQSILDSNLEKMYEEFK